MLQAHWGSAGEESTEVRKTKLKCLFFIYVQYVQKAVLAFYILNPHRNPMKWCFPDWQRENKGSGSKCTVFGLGSQTQWMAVLGFEHQFPN